jgi:hypothetical protein
VAAVSAFLFLHLAENNGFQGDEQVNSLKGDFFLIFGTLDEHQPGPESGPFMKSFQSSTLSRKTPPHFMRRAVGLL